MKLALTRDEILMKLRGLARSYATCVGGVDSFVEAVLDLEPDQWTAQTAREFYYSAVKGQE